MSGLRSFYDKLESDILGKISSQQDEKKKHKTEKENKLHRIELDLNDALNDLKDERHIREVDLRERISCIKVLIETRALTEEERRKEEQVQNDVHDRETEFVQASGHFNNLRAEINQLEGDLSKIHIELDHARESTSAQEKHIETLMKTLFPEENTLLSHLRLNKPDWVNNIGRLIQPEILARN